MTCDLTAHGTRGGCVDATKNEAYCDGVAEGLALLAEWQLAGETGLSPGRLKSELRTRLACRDGGVRDGMTDTIAAFLILALDGSLPILERWDVVEDLSTWGEAVRLEILEQERIHER